jgi:hypothetical protein
MQDVKGNMDCWFGNSRSLVYNGTAAEILKLERVITLHVGEWLYFLPLIHINNCIHP